MSWRENGSRLFCDKYKGRMDRVNRGHSGKFASDLLVKAYICGMPTKREV